MMAGSNAAARSDRRRPSLAQDMAKDADEDRLNGFIRRRASKWCAGADACHVTEVVMRVERGENRRDRRSAGECVMLGGGDKLLSAPEGRDGGNATTQRRIPIG